MYSLNDEECSNLFSSIIEIEDDLQQLEFSRSPQVKEDKPWTVQKSNN